MRSLAWLGSLPSTRTPPSLLLSSHPSLVHSAQHITMAIRTSSSCSRRSPSSTTTPDLIAPLAPLVLQVLALRTPPTYVLALANTFNTLRLSFAVESAGTDHLLLLISHLPTATPAPLACRSHHTPPSPPHHPPLHRLATSARTDRRLRLPHQLVLPLVRLVWLDQLLLDLRGRARRRHPRHPNEYRWNPHHWPIGCRSVSLFFPFSVSPCNH